MEREEKGKLMRTETHRHRLSSYKRISPRTARVGLIIVGFVLAIDILAARFSAEIQSALTLPVAQIKFAAPQHVVPTAQARVTVPTPQMSPVPATSPSPAKNLALPHKNMLAQDTFQRPNQASCGSASDAH